MRWDLEEFEEEGESEWEWRLEEIRRREKAEKSCNFEIRGVERGIVVTWKIGNRRRMLEEFSVRKIGQRGGEKLRPEKIEK